MLEAATRWLALALLLSLLAGCAGFGGYRDSVRVSVAGVEVIESTVFEQVYRVTLRVQNRGDTPIQLRGGHFDLVINGKDFGSGVTDASLTVPAYADETLDVRMVSTLFGMVRLFQGLVEPDNSVLTYEISGRFSTDGVIGGLGFSEDGEISLPRRDAESDGVIGQP